MKDKRTAFQQIIIFYLKCPGVEEKPRSETDRSSVYFPREAKNVTDRSSVYFSREAKNVTDMSSVYFSREAKNVTDRFVCILPTLGSG